MQEEGDRATGVQSRLTAPCFSGFNHPVIVQTCWRAGCMSRVEMLNWLHCDIFTAIKRGAARFTSAEP